MLDSLDHLTEGRYLLPDRRGGEKGTAQGVVVLVFFTATIEKMSFRLTSTLKILLAANLFVFILQHTVDRFLGGNFSGIFGLVPARVVLDGHLWQIFTYSFLHGDVTHLFLNLLMLVFIGGEIEGLWGRNRVL